MNQGFTIRSAAADDAALLAQVIRDAFEEYRGVLDPPSGAHTETPESIADTLMQGGGFVALDRDRAAGGVVYLPRGSHVYLGRLAVLPPYRRSGLGEALVTRVEAAARAIGQPVVSLGVRTSLPGNQRFFERLGYRVVAAKSHPGYSEPTFITLEKHV